MIRKKPDPNMDNILHIFKPSEAMAWKDFKSRHNNKCGCNTFIYYINDLIDIECSHCHERINLNRSY